MIAMSNIGATTSTWRQIMNENQTTANDAESILNYFGQVFGENVRRKVEFGSDNWYLDQKMISIRVQEWIDKQNSSKLVSEKSDTNFYRLDRANWRTDVLTRSMLRHFFDAHLPINGYVPSIWKTIRPLIRFMYNDSWQVEWSECYATTFYEKLPVNKR